MKVRDVMTSPAITVGPDAPYVEIIQCLLTHDISGIPVVDDDGRLLGIVTEGDLVFKEAYGERGHQALALVGEIIQGYPAPWVRKVAARTARDLMTTETVVAGLDDELAAAARRMLRTPCKRLPVVRDGRVVGIISRHDILRRFDRADKDIAADVASVVSAWTMDPHEVVKFTVTNGVVALCGSVADRDRACRLKNSVSEVDGVVDIDDGIVVT